MKILIFGDSITYGCWDSKGGWVARLRERIDKKVMEDDSYSLVYNLGIPSDKTQDLLLRFDEEVKPRQRKDPEMQMVIIFAIGINDSQYVYEQKEHRVPLNVFSDNLRKLISKARAYTSDIFFIGLTPVDEKRTAPLEWDKRKCYKNEYIKKYDQEIRKICESEGVEYIEVASLFPTGQLSELLFDGLHPNDEGHRRIFEKVFSVFSKKLDLQKK